MTATPTLAGAGPVQPAVHGGINYLELQQLGVDPSSVVDFSTNVNPVPPALNLPELCAGIDFSAYPDTNSTRLCAAAADHFQVAPDQVLAANGSAELIHMACRAFVRPGETVSIESPTFGEYEVAARIQGAGVTASSDGAALAFRCNPNNPTGVYSGALTSTNARMTVVDEAYADFVRGRPTLIRPAMPENLLVLRSLTKTAGLAGLRIGLAIGSPRTIERMRAVQPPWNVNALAQAAGERLLCDRPALPDLDRQEKAIAFLRQGLAEMGLQSNATSCNFFLVGVGEAPRVRLELLKLGLLVRDCTSFGLPRHIRVAWRTLPDCEKLLAGMRQIGAYHSS